MEKYISKEYINNMLCRYLNNWRGPEYYACSTIQDEINDAPDSEVIYIYKCSNCGSMSTEHYQFCTCCGKPMDEERLNGRN